jgi:hypothetical protein
MDKMDPVVHFEMPADDRERMAEFYRRAFGWKTQMLGPEMGEYVLVATTESDESGPKKPGVINGGFFPRKPDWPAQHPSVVIAVDDVRESIDKVGEAGGGVLGEPMEIPGVGHYVSFIDTEGNRVSMLQPSQRERPRTDVAALELLPGAGSGDGRPGLRAHRVRGGQRRAVAVSTCVDVDAPGAVRLAELLSEALRIALDEERAHGVGEARDLGDVRARVDRDDDVEALRARRLDPARKAQLVEEIAEPERRRPEGEGDVMSRPSSQRTSNT